MLDNPADAPTDDPLARLLYRTLTGGEWVDDGRLTLEQRQCSDMADAVRAGGYVRMDPDLLRAALQVVACASPWHVAHAVRYPASIGTSHDELHAVGEELQARAREALRMFPEEAKARE